MLKSLFQEQQDFYDLYCDCPRLRDYIHFGDECKNSVSIDITIRQTVVCNKKRMSKEMKLSYKTFVEDYENETFNQATGNSDSHWEWSFVQQTTKEHNALFC